MKKFLFIPLILVFLSISFYVSAADLVFKTRLNSARECAVCHYEMVKVFVDTKKSTTIAPYSKTNVVADEKMCFSCHNGSVLDSRDRVWNIIHKNHKTGIELKKGMKQKKPLPLLDNKITCATCHTPHSIDDRGIDEINNNLFLRLYNDRSELCVNCHEDRTTRSDHSLKELDPVYRKAVHQLGGKLSKDGKVLCESCHEVHGSSYDNLTRLDPKTVSLCNVCHEDVSVKDPSKRLAIMPHSASSVLSDKVKLLLKKENKESTDGKLSCFVCHSVHNAKGIALLNVAKKDTDYCNKCHEGYDKVAKGSHDLSEQKNFKTPDGRTVMEVNLCGTCHGGHKFRTDKKFVNSDDPERVCLTCHSKNNKKSTASDRYIDITLSNHFTGDIADAISKKRIVVSDYRKLEDSVREYINVYTLAKKSLQIANKGNKIVCTSCHDIHGDKPLFLRKPIESGELCLSCHAKNGVMSTGHGNKKLTASCVSCHKLHNNNNKQLIRNYDKNDGCLSCHKESKIFSDKFDGKSKEMMLEAMPDDLVMKKFNHPTAIDNKTIFPAPMNNQKDGRFSCVTCHDPHRSGDKPIEKNFLRLDKEMKEMKDFCIRCHADVKDIVGSDHDMKADKKVVVDKRTGRVASTCDNCHKTHDAETEKNIFNKKGVVKNDDICLTCHKKDGDAKDKAVDITKGHKLGIIEKVSDNVSKKYLVVDKKGGVLIECRTCHDPHKNIVKADTEGDISNSFLKLPTDNKTVCLNCHTEQASIFGGGHDITNVKNKDASVKAKIKINDQCSNCHTTHNSEARFMMPGKTSQERCEQCHTNNMKGKTKSDEMIKTSHISEVEMKDKNSKNLPLENNKIVCLTCHNPHSSRAKLDRSDGRKDELCISCHSRAAVVLTSPHNMQLAKITDTKLLDKTKDNVCEGCHPAHNFDADSFKMTAANKNGSDRAIEASCVNCHSRSGVAKSVPENLRHPSMMKNLENVKLFEGYLFDVNGVDQRKGFIECKTCHSPHEWSRYKSKSSVVGAADINGDNSTSFLKADIDTKFCFTCHEDAAEWYNNFHKDEERKKYRQIRRPDTLFNRIIKSVGKE